MDTIEFEARPCVDWVNGEPVPKDRVVHLTEHQARFDLEQGRIERRPAKRKTAAGSADADV